jgi:prefoldin alpha subunit
MTSNNKKKKGKNTTPSPTNEENDSTIDLDSLSLEQLQQVQQQEEARLQMWSTRYAQLRSAAARIQASQKAVQEISTQTQSAVLVPLTESLYVPAKMSAAPLLVELGTGYFAQQSPDQCCQYLSRKLALVQANSETMTRAVEATRSNLQAVAAAQQGKRLEIHARQEGARLVREQAAAASQQQRT